MALLPPFPALGESVRITRSGPASLCRSVYECLMQNRSAVVVVDSETAQQVRSLFPLFFREKGGEEEGPTLVYERTLLDFLPCMGRDERIAPALTLASLHALTEPRPHCVIASLESLLLRHVPLTFFSNRILSISTNEDYVPQLVLEQAVNWGYQRVPMVAAVGDIAVRGDIVDIFPPSSTKPLRIEFFGDTVEEIRIFDADTQRSRETVFHVRIVPLSPTSLTIQEREQAYARFHALKRQGKLSENACYSVRKGLEEGDFGLLPGIIFDDSTLLEQWLPKDAVWFLTCEEDLAQKMDALRSDLKLALEDEEKTLLQPVDIALRTTTERYPWAGAARVVFSYDLSGEPKEGEVALAEQPIHSFDALFPNAEARDRPWQALIEALKKWIGTYRQVLLCFATVRGRTKFLHLAAQDGISPKLSYARGEAGLFALVAPFRQGAVLSWENTIILGEKILFPRSSSPSRKASSNFRGLRSFESLQEGDLLVHRDYGVGRFGGLHTLTVNKVENEFLLIEYAGHDKLYVPADNLSLIQRYKGGEGKPPALDKLSGHSWQNSKEKVRKAIEKIAADLVEMYAYRKVVKGFNYGPIPDLYREFEATFPYEETPDQARAIQDVLHDLEQDSPMDRLICGDVGFGKTEVALRAAVRCTCEGRQVALLCPTTVLAEQHYQTFRSRLAGFPMRVGLLSRFVPRIKQREVLEAAANGSIDILIGTHRLLSNDVSLPNLGLLILDEEQRFGVRHKEKLKALKKDVDVLTLSATPIPRTLQMSMSGIRELSLIETPPENRKPVSTVVVNRDDALLRKVLRTEIERKGQAFWVYNRVNGLDQVCAYIRELIPEARVAMAHGQMTETALENVMYSFWHGELDILVCTAIVESGLDFPNVNTIVIDQAQMYGLGQLYQLRGRVGRSERQAYAYLIVPDKKHLPPLAAERLRIIQSMDYLGAGFQLAMEDLRLRGAGNILGEVQSGQMSRVGLDMYLEMLEEAVARLKGLPVRNEVESEINLGLPAHIPVAYIDDSQERMRFYKRLTAAENPGEREEIMLEIRDRFGTLPKEVTNFIAVLNLKSVLRPLEIARADIYTDRVNLVWVIGQKAVKPADILAWAGTVKGSKITPPATLTVPLAKDQPFEKALETLRQGLLSLLTGGTDRRTM
ncbi:MAG: transcription-repair coupling factor [Desulfovibrionaceae bacterium]|nr:transcription-repair coupling factor [Desulfovibrionaceae bacterium]